MGALVIYDSDGAEIPIFFDVGGTIFSCATACAFVYVGLRISTQDRVFTKDKDELMKMLLGDAKSISMKTAQDKGYIYRMALLKGLGPLCLGGLCTGLGVCLMHYVGMMAMRGCVEIDWNIGIVTASVLIAVIASTAAFWILFRLLALFPRSEVLRIVSSLVMAIAVCGMHYTGMFAANFAMSSTVNEGIVGGRVSSDIAVAIAIDASVAINILLFTLLSAEQRAWNLNVQMALRKSHDVMEGIKERYPELQKMQQYSAYNGFLSQVEASRMSQGDSRSSKAVSVRVTRSAKIGQVTNTIDTNEGIATLETAEGNDIAHNV